MITLVPVDRIDAVWPHVRDGLHKAVMRTGGDLTTAELWQGCRRGDIFMLAAYDADKLTGVSLWKPELWQTGQRLRCLALAGTIATLKEMRVAGMQLRADLDCISIIGEGSQAYRRIFTKAKPVRILYEEYP